MTSYYNLEQETAHGMFAVRWDDKLNRPVMYTLADSAWAITYHQSRFGYTLRRVPHHPKRSRYRLNHDVRKVVGLK